MGDPLTVEDQFALRPELGGLMRTAHIAGPDALHGAPATAQTSDVDNREVGNPIVLGGSGEANVSSETGDRKFAHIEGFSE